MRPRFWVCALFGVSIAFSACDASNATSDNPDASTDSTGVETDAGPATGGCRPASGTTGSPQTITDAVALLNGLPQPVTLPCFLESLDRPLGLVATTNIVSAQPAESPRNPRIFLLTGRLSLAFVPDGANRDVLELGEISADNQNSIKGEIHFPVEGPMMLAAPFDRILDNVPTQTKCSLCHFPERTVDRVGYEHAFESIAYRPNPLYAAPLEDLRREHQTCDAAGEPERCATLKATFGHGEVVGGTFPPEMSTFF